MKKPDKAQLETALQEAEQMRVKDADPQHLAKTLLYLNERQELLDRLYHAADNYINHGGFPHQHAELASLVEQLKKLEIDDRHADDIGLGLG